MTATSATASGTFMLGGDIKINRMGFGAMRITGKGIWDQPEDRPEALRVLNWGAISFFLTAFRSLFQLVPIGHRIPKSLAYIVLEKLLECR